MDRWSGLMSPELRLQLEPSDLKSLELLENVVSGNEELDNFEVNERGCVLVRSGQAEIKLDILEAYARTLENGPRVAIKIGVQGFPEYHREVRMTLSEDTFVGDLCASFVLVMVNLGNVRKQGGAQHLIEEINRANRFANDNKDEDGNEDETT